jgi:hypothetical protein
MMLMRIAVIIFMLLLGIVIFYAMSGVADTGICPQDHPKCGVPEAP